MRLLHLADLHYGKRINNLSLIEDQKYINHKILQEIDRLGVEAVLMAGDIYDKSIPSEEAVSLFDDFLVELAGRKLPVLIIAGNHDSAERLSFGDRLIEASNIYISPKYDGDVKKVTLQDEYGEIHFHLMPFVKPVHIKHYYPEETIESQTDALKVAISHMDIDPDKRNVILSHQFVTGAKKDGSEDELSVGGTDNVDSWVYDAFDYAALGHIHRPQNVSQDKIRYCGSAMKYSFNEEKQNKALCIVDIKEKGLVEIQNVPIEAMRDFVTVKGTYDELKKGSELVGAEDFVHVILTDEDDIPNAFSNLSITYPNIMSMSYDNRRTHNDAVLDGGELEAELNPEELFADFFEIRNNQKMSEEQISYVSQIIGEIWRD